jgi:GNAT superfamily N-acetyltransferase
MAALTHNQPYRADPWMLQRGLLWSARFDTPTPSHTAARIPAEFSRVEDEHLPALLAAAAQVDAIAPEALLLRRELGRQCYAGWVEGKIAAYGWLTRGPEWVGEFQRKLNVADGEAYIWDCATLPAHRRLHLFSALIGSVAGQLARQGLRQVWIIAAVTTPAMNHDIAEAGFRPVLALTYVQLFRRHLLLTVPAPQASAQSRADGLRLLGWEGERRLGPLLLGAARVPGP